MKQKDDDQVIGKEGMKYIIMCGGTYAEWKTPKHLLMIGGETIVGRTIRLLRENGIEDIAISSNDDRFEGLGVPVLRHKNKYEVRAYNDFDGYWCNCFYPLNEPVCYLCGDVIFSPAAIKTIVETETDSIEFFASQPPFSKEYIKPWAEPFAFKVVDQIKLWAAITKTKIYDMKGCFNRKPLAWEFWNVVKKFPLNQPAYGTYTAINDYTCDIDNESDVEAMERILG